MSINDQTTSSLPAARCLKNRPNVMLSFEVMPPRSDAAVEPFFRALDDLLTVRPDFISVTYGAGGKDRKNATGLVATLVDDTPTHPIAHLTTVGATREEIADVIAQYLELGVRSFLALRGDPPVDNPEWVPGPHDVRSAAELISLIKLIEARRAATHSGLALRQALRPLTIAVATFVEGNPQAGTTAEQEIDNLLVKQEAGANLAITQVFWNVHAYERFVLKARAAGVRIPIVPGVLAPVSVQRLKRVGELTGVQAPADLIAQLEAAPDPFAEGVGIAGRAIRRLVDAGAPGIHIYSFNKSEPALAILKAAGLIGVQQSCVQLE